MEIFIEKVGCQIMIVAEGENAPSAPDEASQPTTPQRAASPSSSISEKI